MGSEMCIRDSIQTVKLDLIVKTFKWHEQFRKLEKKVTLLCPRDFKFSQLVSRTKRKTRNGGHVGGPKRSFGNCILCKEFLLFQGINMAAGHVTDFQLDAAAYFA